MKCEGGERACGESTKGKRRGKEGREIGVVGVWWGGYGVGEGGVGDGGRERWGGWMAGGGVRDEGGKVSRVWNGGGMGGGKR